MAVVFTNLSWWLWRGKEHDPNTVPSATLNSSMDLNLGMRESDMLKFASVNGAKMRAESRRVKRKWHSREERKIDREYDLVLVPSDGGWASGSESDDSDWSIGWMEPHAPDFQTDDDETEDSFAVLVPCYAHAHAHEDRVPTPNDNQHLGAIVDLTNAYSADMEEKVQCMLKIIDDDGDSFAKRAEMYYKRRPELINFVEESFRAYRSLAERYEHIAGELQTANQTIATVFPEHAQIAMEDEDEDVPPKKSTGSSNQRKPTKELPEAPPNIPKFTLISKPTRSSTTKPEPKKTAKPTKTSNKSNSEALAEIDKLQKGILVLQTEKEFIKGSYENGLAKYWEIEKQIAEMQRQVCSLQEEFGVGTVIEDDEARTLMAATALKSCKETLIHLQEKHEKSNEEARVENQRIQDICKQLESLKDEYLHNQKDQHKFEKENSEAKVPSLTKAEERVGKSKEEMHDLESICQMIRKNFANNSNQALAVAELAETIDELVTKVMNLETLVSSQTALIERLRSETNELHIKVQSLEHDKETLIEGSNNMNHELQKLDKELCGIQELNKNVEDHGNTLHMYISEAHSKFAHISEELHCMNQQDVAESTNPFLQGEDTITPAVNRVSTMGKTEGKEDVHDRSLQVDNGEEDHTKLEDHSVLDDLSAKEKGTNHQDADEKQDKEDNVFNDETQDQANDQEDQPNWQQLFLDGMEDREKILLVEYTTTLRNYKEIKRKLLEIEKKNQDSLTETTQQLSKLESNNAMKDEEIRSLRQKLKLIPTSSDKNSNKSTDSASSQMPGLQEEGSVSKDENVAPNSRADGLSGAAETPTEQDEEIKVTVKDEPRNPSSVEEKFRKDIDGLLEENLKFWLRFSTSFHHIQKFQTAVEDLGAEYSMVKGKKKQDDNTSTDNTSTTDRTSIDHTTTKDQPLKSAVRPIYDHLSEIQKEIKDWLEHNASFKGELQCRLSSLSKIQEEISTVSKEGSENEEVKFTSYQAAKFQGEVLNMQQENNKVAEELEAGLEHVKAIEIEIKKLLVQLSKDLEFSGSKSIEDVERRESNVERTDSMSNGDLRSPGSSNRRAELRHSETKTQIPLRSFLFGGTKPKKHKPKLFTLIHPALHRQSKS